MVVLSVYVRRTVAADLVMGNSSSLQMTDYHKEVCAGVCGVLSLEFLGLVGGNVVNVGDRKRLVVLQT